MYWRNSYVLHIANWHKKFTLMLLLQNLSSIADIINICGWELLQVCKDCRRVTEWQVPKEGTDRDVGLHSLCITWLEKCYNEVYLLKSSLIFINGCTGGGPQKKSYFSVNRLLMKTCFTTGYVMSGLSLKSVNMSSQWINSPALFWGVASCGE